MRAMILSCLLLSACIHPSVYMHDESTHRAHVESVLYVADIHTTILRAQGVQTGPSAASFTVMPDGSVSEAKAILGDEISRHQALRVTRMIGPLQPHSVDDGLRYTVVFYDGYWRLSHHPGAH